MPAPPGGAARAGRDLLPRGGGPDDQRAPGGAPLLLLRLPALLQSPLRSRVPQLAPADLEVVPRDRVATRRGGRSARERAAESAGRQLQDGVVRRAPDSRRTL